MSVFPCAGIRLRERFDRSLECLRQAPMPRQHISRGAYGAVLGRRIRGKVYNVSMIESNKYTYLPTCPDAYVCSEWSSLWRDSLY